jgi:hypothetical protein
MTMKDLIQISQSSKQDLLEKENQMNALIEEIKRLIIDKQLHLVSLACCQLSTLADEHTAISYQMGFVNKCLENM